MIVNGRVADDFSRIFDLAAAQGEIRRDRVSGSSTDTKRCVTSRLSADLTLIERKLAGLTLYHELMDRADAELLALGQPIDNPTRQRYLEKAFQEFPDDWETLRHDGLAYFRPYRGSQSSTISGSSQTSFEGDDGHAYEPVTYEDFLPASAAGIFQYNLGQQHLTVSRAGPDQEAFEKALGSAVLDSHNLYKAEADGSADGASSYGSPMGIRE